MKGSMDVRAHSKKCLFLLGLFLWLGQSSAETLQQDAPDLEKRAEMSVNLDLMSIARMMNQNKDAAEAQDTLMRLGKRGAAAEDGVAFTAEDDDDDAKPLFVEAYPQKRRPISINQDLMSISNMMGSNRAAEAQNLLHSLGKRASLSVNQDLMSISRMLGSEGQASDAADFLLRLGKRSPWGSPQVVMLEAGSPEMERWKSYLQAAVKRQPIPLSEVLVRSQADQRQSFLNSRSAGDFSDNMREKRRPLSVNQDLMTISRMMGGGSKGGDASFLHRLGKRRPISVNQDLMSISRMMGDGGRSAQAQSFLHALGKR